MDHAFGVIYWKETEVRDWLVRQHITTLIEADIDSSGLTGPDLLRIDEEDLTARLPSLTNHQAGLLWSSIKKLRKTDEEMSLLLSLQIFKAEARDVETEMRKELDEKMETLFSDAVLAAQLQLQEADILQDVLHDSFEALKYDASALHAFEEERADWEAAQQLARALEAQQRQEEEDFMLAHRLAGLRVPATRTRESSSTASSPRSSIDDAGPSTLSAGSSFASTSESSSSVQNKAALLTEVDVAVGDATAGRSTGKGKEKAHAVSKTSAQRDCAACLEKKPRMYHLASTCKHSYCQDCLSGLFTVASKDDTLLPVRCCKQPIDQTLADELLSGETAREFKQRLREIQTVNKMYCPSPTCSAFIDLDAISEATQFACAFCDLALCAACRAPWHEGFTCDEFQNLPDDVRHPDDLATILMAEQLGWKQCASCRSIVSISSGCNHITCRCGHQFCYVCATPWKTCECAQWDENLLQEEASRQVTQQEQRTGRLFGQAEGQRRVVAAMNTIRRQNHDCAHDWSRNNHLGGSSCTNCGYYLTRYGFRCEQAGGCERILCRVCRMHRFR